MSLCRILSKRVKRKLEKVLQLKVQRGNSPVVVGAALPVPTRHIGKRKRIKMPIVNVSPPLGWSEASVVAFGPKELLDSFILLHGRLESRSVREPSATRVARKKVNTVVDCIGKIYRDDWNHQVSQIDRRV